MPGILDRLRKSRYTGGTLAFILPAAILLAAYFIIGLSPFGNKSMLSLDLAAQYVHFYAELKDAVFGDGSIIYSWSRTLGGEFLGMVAYYLASPFTLIIIIMPKTWIGFAVASVILIKTGMCGLTMHIYLRKSKGMEQYEALIFSVLYALCAYVVVYGSNIMWLDGVFILPMIALGIEKLVSCGKCTLFIFSLAYGLFANYYIGYMLCIFSLIYFFCVLFSAEYDGNLGIFALKSILRAAVSSVCAAMCAAVMLLPAYRSLTFGKSTFSNPDFSLRPTADFITELTKLFPGTYDSVDYGGTVYVYCGILVLMLMPLYFTLKSVSVRQKLGMGVLLLFLGASVSFTTLDVFWHGFQYPNWLNHRYSFIISFLLVTMAAQVWAKREEISSKSVFVVAGFIGLVLVQIQVSGPEEFGLFESLVFSAVVTGVYLAIIGALKGTGKKSLLTSLLCVTVCAELLVSSAVSLYKYGNDVVYTASGRIEGNISKYSPSAEAIKKLDTGLFRTERYGNRLNNDPFSLGFNGLTSSTSTVNSSVITLLNSLGYVSYSNFTRYTTINPAADSLLGVKYIISDERIDNAVHIEETGLSPTEGVTVYKNPYALPVAFMSSPQILDVSVSGEKSPFETINNIYSALAGRDVEVFRPAVLKSVGRSGTVPKTEDGLTYYTDASPGTTKQLIFRLSVEEGQELYSYFPSPYKAEFELSVNGESLGMINGTDTYATQYLGRAQAGEVEIQLSWDEGSISMYNGVNYFYILDTALLEEVCAELSTGGLELSEHSETELSGSVNAEYDGVMFTTIPYDSDWQVYIDGERAETFSVCSSLLAFNVSGGEHQITIKYVSGVFIYGMLISVAGILLLCAFAVYENGGVKGVKNKILYVRKYLKRTGGDAGDAGDGK